MPAMAQSQLPTFPNGATSVRQKSEVPGVPAPYLPHDLRAVPEVPASQVPETSSPRGGCNVIVNGEFETGDFTGWTIQDIDTPPVVTNTNAHSGTYSAFAGGHPPQFCGFGNEIAGDSSFYQQFTVPASGGTLSFWHWECTTDSITFDWQDAYITDSKGNLLQIIFHQCSNAQTWINTVVDLAPYAGQTVRIEFLVHEDTGVGDLTGMYVDDAEVLCGAPSPTPTATPSCTPIVVTGSITNGDPTQVHRVFRSGTASTCGAPGSCSILSAGAIHYNAYTFTNTSGSTQCVTVDMNTSCIGTNNIFTVAYLESFDPNNICTNYLADEGLSPTPANQFSFNLDHGQTVVLVVSEVTSGAGCPSYTMTVSGVCVSGTPTPTPTPTATPTPTPTPGGITLTASGRRVQGRHTVDLSWSGSNAASVDIYRDGVVIATVPNNGAYKDFIGVRGGNVRYTYKVCDAGTQNCSNEVTVRFGGPPL